MKFKLYYQPGVQAQPTIVPSMCVVFKATCITPRNAWPDNLYGV